MLAMEARVGDGLKPAVITRECGKRLDAPIKPQRRRSASALWETFDGDRRVPAICLTRNLASGNLAQRARSHADVDCADARELEQAVPLPLAVLEARNLAVAGGKAEAVAV